MKRYIILLAIALSALLSTEMKAEGYLTPSDFPAAEKFLPPPPDTTGQRFVSDWVMYQWGKNYRTGLRANEAITDASLGAMVLCKVFTPAFGMTLSNVKSPQIFKLINTLRQDVVQATATVKAKYKRKRPFDQFKDFSLIPANEAAAKTSSSYVSEYAAVGWAVALVLAEINIDRQDTILSRGYQFGESRVIAGYDYESDVECGRVVGMTTIARLHANDAFMAQLEKAKAEYATMTGISSKVYVPKPSDADFYNLQGVKVEESDIQHGDVYIHDGQKAIKR